MRDIKFRAWFGIPESHLAPSMTYLDVSKFQDQEYFLIVRHSDNLMQYTGLKDKNGVEIYEGDLIKDSYTIDPATIFEVVYHLGGFTVKNIDSKYAQPASNDYFRAFQDKCEVIGNIYENPELLEANELKENN